MEDWVYRGHYELEDRHWWFRVRRRVLWALLQRSRCPPPLGSDAGCGTGRNLVEFGLLGRAESVDMSPQAVQFCRDRGLALEEALIAALRVGSDLLGPTVAAAVGVDRYELHAPAAALARMIVERPRNDPISTILPGAETRRAASQSRRACASVSQPSTSPVCANAS